MTELEIIYKDQPYYIQGDFYGGEYGEPDETNYCNELIEPYFQIDCIYHLDDDGGEIELSSTFGIEEIKEIEQICINELS